jgi:hypothetical protein
MCVSEMRRTSLVGARPLALCGVCLSALLPTPCHPQSLPTPAAGTPVLLDLRVEGLTVQHAPVRAYPPPAEGIRIEGVLTGPVRDSVRVLSSDASIPRVYSTAEVSHMWVEVTRVRGRTGLGALLGGLLGGGIMRVVSENNGGSLSCGRQPSTNDLSAIIHASCRAAKTADGLKMAGGILLGGAIGGMVGSRIRREVREWVPFPLPNATLAHGGETRIMYSLPVRSR